MTQSTQAMRLAHIMFKANKALISFGDCLISAWRMVKRWNSTVMAILSGAKFRTVSVATSIQSEQAHDVYLYIEPPNFNKAKKALKSCLGRVSSFLNKPFQF